LFFTRARDAGRLWGVVHQGMWFDVGTPAAVGEAEAVLAEM
jgi:MurNAc alpha-1-phosphate uridylyltransferase